MTGFQSGTIEKLTVSQEVAGDYVLTNGDDIIVLPKQEVNSSIEVEEEIDVFIYQNKKDQLIATMTLPRITRENYDWAEVIEKVRGLGVFVDVGLRDDILVSSDDLPLIEKVWPKPGDELFVTLETDKKGRMLAKPATETVVQDSWSHAPKSINNQLIGGRVYRSTKVGSFIITEAGYRGFIHHFERKIEPRLGEWVEGRVIDVKDDGTINVTLRPLKQEGIEVDAEAIYYYLVRAGGEMKFTDKSDPEAIRDTFKLSKAAFKRALGKLMKEGKVEQKDGVTSVKKEEE
ncbi:CvfB family protein [Alteribacter populi]|uniref:CvfB family protein n=1 Tax=Alteribacter populi TaxID=2011011 RepID=UPI000BBB342C|nr:S1-like domain-containing RNA-binding protein [Alteribacter populi]